MEFSGGFDDYKTGTPGDYGFKVLTSSDPEEKTKKLSAELANLGGLLGHFTCSLCGLTRDPIYISISIYICLYYTILYYIILYYIILHYTILYYIILYYMILYCIILYYTTSKKSTCLPRQVLRCRGVPAVLSCCVCELLIWGRQLCKFTSFALTQQLTVDANGGVNQKWYGPHFGGSHWRFASLKGCSAWQAVHPSFSCPRPRYEITTLPTCVRSANSEGGCKPPDY